MTSKTAFTKISKPVKIIYEHVSKNSQTSFAKEINIVHEVDYCGICPIPKFKLNAIERYEQKWGRTDSRISYLTILFFHLQDLFPQRDFPLHILFTEFLRCHMSTKFITFWAK